MKYLLIGLSFLALIFAGSVWYLHATSSHKYEVRYTSKGFEPARLTVPLGTSVTFTNTTNTPLLVASDPYPTHADYPQFVAPQAIGAGKTFVFTFTKAGTFGYDNDEKNSDRGFIEVSDPATQKDMVVQVIKSQQPALEHLLTLFKPGDPDSIFTVIDAVDGDPSIKFNCHQLSHALGHRAYEMYGFSAAMTYNNPARAQHVPVESICTSGFMHGIMEEVFYHQPDIVSSPGSLCATVPEEVLSDCYHGVGHALMFLNKRSIAPSLDGCRSLNNAYYTYRCFQGVWMELFGGNIANSGPGTFNWDLNKPLDPCIATKEDAKKACFIYAPLGYLIAHRDDYKGALHLCTASGLNDTDTSSCVRGVGLLITPYFNGTHLEDSEQYAAVLSKDLKTSFYSGLLSYGLLYNISRSDLAVVCERMQADKAICTTALSTATAK